MRDRIKESDWKIFRRVHQTALERFCDGILAEIQYFVTDRETNSHARYLEIFKRIHERNEKMATLFDDKKRSNALFQLAGFRHHGLITDEEYAEFSQELRDEVEMILRVGRM